MFSSTGLGGLWTMAPEGERKLSPAIWRKGRPSATSLMVKSNSLSHTKSIAGDALRLSSGLTATAAPTRPILIRGFISRKASATLRSEAKEGVEVCRTRSSYFDAIGKISARRRPAGGASTSLLSGTSAAGWANHVGYQKERTSRRAW